MSSDTKHTPIAQNFVYPEISHEDRTFGYSLVGQTLRVSKDWRDYLPPIEEQNIRGVESSACFIEGQQHVIATLLEEAFLEPDKNFSARFNALLSKGTSVGGDPVRGAKSIKYDGLIPDRMMPFGGEIKSWADFHSWKGVKEKDCRAEGKRFLNEWKLNFKIEVEKEMPVAAKYALLKEALSRSPVAISVAAWWNEDGLYIKPNGVRDNHLVEAVYVDENNRIYVRDTYSPFQKILAPNYDFEFGISWVVEKNLTGMKISIITKMIELLKQLITQMEKLGKLCYNYISSNE